MAENSAQILDCTLRDGGYRNDWQFGEETVAGVLAGLCAAGVDWVECGFLADEAPRAGRTVFRDAAALARILPRNTGTRFVAMAIWGHCDLAALPDAARTGLFGLRLSFDRHEAGDALAGARLLREKGYAVFVQPVRLTTSYTADQLAALLEGVNRLRPFAFYGVDTLGALLPEEAAALYRRICAGLAPGIAGGWHAHNHRQLALAGALAVAGAKQPGRPLILDSCLGGMGKAAGNVPTEMLAHALAGQGQTGGRLGGVLNALDALGPTPPSLPYFLCSIAGCNTAYADWLMANGAATAAGLYAALCRLPRDSRPFFDEAAARRLL